MKREFGCLALIALAAGCSGESGDVSVMAGTAGWSSGGGFVTSFSERYRSIPIEVISPDGTAPTVYVRVSNADAMIRQRGDQSAEQYEQWVLDELKIYTDEAGNSWRRPNLWSVNSMLDQLAPEFDMVLRTVDEEMIEVFGDDTCATGCIVSIRASFADPGSARNRENFWEQRPEFWSTAELSYVQGERIEMTSLTHHDVENRRGDVELGVLTLELTEDGAHAALGTRSVAVRTPPWSSEADGGTVRGEPR